MNAETVHLREKIRRITDKWLSGGLPSREKLESTVISLDRWKQDHQVKGIWPNRRPLMATTTLDDGLGQGLQVIERYAAAAGLRVNQLGLLKKPDFIVEQCHRLQPDFLGLTILQLDSEDDLARVGHGKPPETVLIAGGPVFKFDPPMAQRCKVDYVAPNVAYFMDFLLRF